jgi:hypothetical protein
LYLEIEKLKSQIQQLKSKELQVIYN